MFTEYISGFLNVASISSSERYSEMSPKSPGLLAQAQGGMASTSNADVGVSTYTGTEDYQYQLDLQNAIRDSLLH